MYHDLASGFLQITIIDEMNKHITVFRDSGENLWEIMQFDFGPRSLTSAFANYVGGGIMKVKNRACGTFLNGR